MRTFLWLENQAFLPQLFETILACFYEVKRCVYQRQDAAEIKSFYIGVGRGMNCIEVWSCDNISMEQFSNSPHTELEVYAVILSRRIAKLRQLDCSLCRNF